MTWSFPHQINLTFGRRAKRLHQYPACGGWGSGGQDHSMNRLFRPCQRSVRPPGSAETDRFSVDCVNPFRSSMRRYEALYTMAPSMTTPEFTYFHNATSSLRANATMMVFRRRPPLRLTRSWNQRVSAECG